MKKISLISYLFFQLLVYDVAGADLTCSRNGTRIIYVNNFSNSSLVATHLDKLKERYRTSSRTSQIDLTSNVFIENILLPSFGSSYEEFAAKELKINATGIKDPFLFTLLNKSKDKMLDYSVKLELLPVAAVTALGVFLRAQLFSESNDVSMTMVAEKLANYYLYNEDSVKEDLNSLIQDKLLTKVIPGIRKSEKTIYIAHGAGGYFVDGIVKELGNINTTENLLARFNLFNGIVYLGHESGNKYFPGRNQVINFDSDKAVNELSIFPKSNYLNENQDFRQWDDFEFLYLGHQRARARSVASSDNLMSEILDEKIYQVAQTLEDNCGVTFCNVDTRGVTFTFSISGLSESITLSNRRTEDVLNDPIDCACRTLDLQPVQSYHVTVTSTDITCLTNTNGACTTYPILPFDEDVEIYPGIDSFYFKFNFDATPSLPFGTFSVVRGGTTNQCKSLVYE